MFELKLSTMIRILLTQKIRTQLFWHSITWQVRYMMNITSYEYLIRILESENSDSTQIFFSTQPNLILSLVCVKV